MQPRGEAMADIGCDDTATCAGKGQNMPDDDLHRLARRLEQLLTTPDTGKLVILVGAGVTDVAKVTGLTQRALEFSDQVGRARPRAEPNEPVAVGFSEQRQRISRYVEAFQFVREVRGRDGLRAFLQKASLQAHDRASWMTNEGPIDDAAFREIEDRTEGWHVTEGLSLLAEILRSYGSRVQPYLLTTNFDHMVEVALRRSGLPIAASVGIGEDAENVPRLEREAPGWTVVHLHGDCHEGSLHYPASLQQPREAVEDWLAGQLQGNHLLVLGYSGWDELIQRTLLRHFGRDIEAKSEDGVEIMWAVYEAASDHARINAELAEFLERYRLGGVTAYYKVERDRLMRTLTEELESRRGARTRSGTAFYRTAKLLNRNYGFGVSRVRVDSDPTFAFWPHRLRSPHLIHGVHALAAALLSKQGIPIELHLDDVDQNRHYADRTAAAFTDAVTGWFDTCGAPRPKIFRVSELLRSAPEAERALQLWRIAKDFYSYGNSAFDTLFAAKVVTVDADVVTVLSTEANKLLRPIYRWLALEDALQRQAEGGGGSPTAVTIGGIDEHKLWDLWLARTRTPSVASIFVPRLESPTEGASLWHYGELKRDTPYGVRDLERFLIRSAGSGAAGRPLLEWVFNAANRLAAFASEAVPGVRGADGKLMSWREAQERLNHSPDRICEQLAEAVAIWLYADGGGSG
jgi:hypothetical protein